MTHDLKSLRGVRACLWAGPVLCLVFFVGFVPLMDFLPPMHPTDSAEEIARRFGDDTDSIRIGVWCLMVAVGLIAPWGVGLTVLIRRIPDIPSAYTYIQLVTIAIGTTLASGAVLCWAVASYRPDEISAELTRTLNDFGWFFFLFGFPPFLIWFLAVALAIFSDERDEPLFPRWIAYLTLWALLLSLPVGLILFFKTGAFAYNGLIAMYVPLVVFFVWVVVMTATGLRALGALETSEAPRAEYAPVVDA